MSGSANRVIVDVELRAQLDQMRSGVKELEGLFKNLNLSPSKNAGITQLFTDMKKELAEIETLTEGGKIKGSNFSKLEKSVEKVTSLYTKLGKEINTVSGLSNSQKMKLFPPEIANAIDLATNKLKEYKNVEKSLNSDSGLTKKKKDFEDMSEQLNKAKADMKSYEETIEKFNAKEIKFVGKKEFKEAEEALSKAKEDVVEYTKALEEANEKMSHTVPMRKGSETKTHEAARLEVERLQKSLDNAKQKEAELNAEFSKMQVGNIVAINKDLENARNTVAALTPEVQKLDNEIKKIESENPGKAFEIIKQQVQEIKGLDLDWEKITNIEELEQALSKKVGTEVEKVTQRISEIRTKGQGLGQPFNEMVSEVQRANNALQDTASSMKQIEQLAQRGLYFFGLTNQVNLFKRAVQKAFETVKELDKSMTETAVVTDFSVGDMWEQLPQYTKVANEYNATLKDAYDVMTLYYQQGLETNQVFEVGTETMKMARIAGLEYGEATDRMTNALRGFNMEINNMNAEHVADVYSQLAAMSASNVKELSVAMTKVASLANSANMSFDNTAAFLAQIIETTRESAETAGTALKTVVARFSEVKKLYSEGDLIGNVDGEEVNINKVGAALRAAGVDLNEFATGAKGLDEIFIELASKWDSLDLLTQRYIATMAAGSRQQSRFLALMSDNERLTELLNGAYNATGASSEQFAKTQESLQSKLNNLKNAWDQFLMGITNSSIIKGVVDILTGLITAVNKLLNAVGKLGSVPKTFASIGLALGAMKVGSVIITKLASKAIGLVTSFGQVDKAATNTIGIFTSLSQKVNNFSLGKGFLTDLQVAQRQIQIAEQSVNVLGETISKPVSEAGAVIAFKQMENGAIEAATIVDTAGNSIEFELKDIGQDAISTGAALKDGLAEGTKIGVIQAETYLKNLDAQIETEKARMVELKATGGGFDLSTKAGRKGAWNAYQQSEKNLINAEKQKEAGKKIVEDMSKKGADAGKGFSSKFNAHFTPDKGIGKVLNKIANMFGASGAAAGAAYAAAIVAAIAAVAVIAYAAWYKVTDQASKNAAKIQQEALSELQKSTDELSQSVTNLKSAWDSLGEKRETIDNLTQGTAEWYSEVVSLNAEVLKLVEQYSGLDNKLQITSKNGVLDIDLDSYIAATEELADDLNKMTSQSMILSGLVNYNTDKLNSQAELEEQIKKTAKEKMQEEGGFKSEFIINWTAQQSNYQNGKQVYNPNTQQYEIIPLQPGDPGYTKNSADYYAEARAEEEEKYKKNVTDIQNKEARERAKDQVTQGLMVSDKTITKEAAKFAAEVIVDKTDTEVENSRIAKIMEAQVKGTSNSIYGDFSDYGKGAWGPGGKKLNGTYDVNSKEVQDWVKDKNYIIVGSSVIDKSTGEEVKLKEKTAEIAYHAASKTYLEQADEYAKKYQKIFGNNSDIGRILTGDTTVDLNNIELDTSIFKKYYKELGYESAEAFQQAFSDQYELIVEEQNKAKTESIETALTATAGYIPDSIKNAINNFTYEEQKVFQDQMADITQLQMPEVTNTYLKGLQDFIDAGNKIEDLDFSNAVTAYDSLLKISPNNEGLISISEQFQSLFTSGVIDGLSEQIDEFIKENGKITPDNIEELAKSNQTLQKYIDNNTNSTIGLAHALSLIKNGKIGFEEVTDNVLKALSATETLEDTLNELNNFTQNFDAGISYRVGYEFYGETAQEAMDELNERYLYGDQQFENYLGTIFDRDETPMGTNEEIQALYNKASEWKKNDGQNFWNMVGKSDKINWNGNDWIGIENLTTSEAIDQIIAAAADQGNNITEEYAKSQLLNYLAHNKELANSLKANDIYAQTKSMAGETINSDELSTLSKAAGVTDDQYSDYIDDYNSQIDDLEQSLNDLGITFKDLKEGNKTLTNEQEIQLAQDLGISVDDLKNKIKQIQEIGDIHIQVTLGFVDENGKDLSNEDIFSSAFFGKYYDKNGKLVEREDLALFEKEKDINDVMNEDGTVDYDKLTEKMEDRNYTLEQQLALYEAIEDISTGNEKGNKFSKEVKRYNADTREYEIVSTVQGATTAELLENYNNAVKQMDFKDQAKAIAEALTNVELTVDDKNAFNEIKRKLESILNGTAEGANGNQLKISWNGAATLTEQIKAAIQGANNQTITLKAIVQESDTGTTETTEGGVKFGTPARHGKIVTSGPLFKRYSRGGATRNETALVGEEGPELIQLKNGGAYLSGTKGPEMVDLKKGDIVYPNSETKQIYSRGGKESLLNRYIDGTGPIYNRYASQWAQDEQPGTDDDGNSDIEENTDALKENTDALNRTKEALKQGGVWTAPLQLAIVNKQMQLLRKQHKLQMEGVDAEKAKLQVYEDQEKALTDLGEKWADGKVTLEDVKDTIEKLDLFGTNGKGLQGFIDNLRGSPEEMKEMKRNFFNPSDEYYEYASQYDQLGDERDALIGDMIDQGVSSANQAIEGAGQVAQSFLQMIEKVMQSMVDGFKSFLGWLTIRIDDEHDINELNDALKNRKELLDWEFDKLAEKDFDYSKGMHSKSQENLFENINDAAQNILIRLQNQRRLYENSFRQLEDLGTNINSDIEASLEEMYEALYGIDGVFTKINDKVQYLEQRFEKATNWNLTRLREWDPIEQINSWLGTTIPDLLGDALDPLKLFDGSLLDKFFKKSLEQIAGLEITEYRLGNVGESLLQKIANFFYELSPKFDADYQIVNKSELVDALNQKMETIITNDTITAQFVQNYLDYLTEIESQMESEVENIRNAETEILSLYDEMTEILEKGKDEYGELEQAIYDAIISEKESIKEELEELNSNITDADGDLINVLKNNLEQMRQSRENDKTESDLQDKEARLAYLRQDTSGANKQEILKLEKELKEGQQSYTDKLIDQKISELERQNEEAAEQRQIQIDLLQEEINNTKGIWEKVKQMMDAISGYGSWDKLLLGEIKQDAYQAIIDQLKKTSDYEDMSSFAQDNQISDWGVLIRKASLYGTMMKDEYQEMYNDLKIMRDILNVDTKLPIDHAADSGWHDYVAFSNLETAVKKNTDAVQNAVSVINRIVDAKTLSFDETGSIFKKATESGATIQAMSGLEDAVKNFANDVASGLPGILTQVTTGFGNLAKGVSKAAGAALDTAAGAMTLDLAVGDLGEGFGMVMEGVSNLFAAGCDAASLMCDIIGDTSPGFTDMGVAAGTMIANWLDNAFEEVDEHLQENVGYIMDEMFGEEIDGSRLGGYYEQMGIQIEEQKDALKNFYATGVHDANENSEFADHLFKGIIDHYEDIYNQIQKLDPNDIEGFNKQYSRFLTLQKILEKIGHTETVEKYSSDSIQNLEKWAGETGSIFAELSEKERQIVVDAINNAIYDVIKDETYAQDRSKLELWESNLKFKKEDIKYYNDIYKEFVDNVNYSVDAIDEAITAINSVFYDPYENEYTSPSAQLLVQRLEQLEGKRAEQEIEINKTIWETFIDKASDIWGEFGNRILEIGNEVQKVFDNLIDIIKNIFGNNTPFSAAINNLSNSDFATAIRNLAGGHALGGAIRSAERALVGELGPELVQHANGTATIVGRYGPEMADLKAGDQVYTAEQTKRILRGGGSINFNRFAEGTVGNFVARAPLLPGLTSIDIATPTRALADGQTTRENNFNLNLSLEDLTVDSIERVDEVANRVWDKLNSTISNAMWPYNKL